MDPGAQARRARNVISGWGFVARMKQRVPSACLPPEGTEPELIFTLPELQYPAQLNICRQLLDCNLEAGRGNRPAIFFRGRTTSFDELSAAVQSFSASLLDLGLVPGDRVLLQLLESARVHHCLVGLPPCRVGGIVVATMLSFAVPRTWPKSSPDSRPAFVISQEDLFGASWRRRSLAYPTAKSDPAGLAARRCLQLG